MTPEFIAAVLDTLLPGDDRLPSATRAGLVPDGYAASHGPVLDAIARQAGSIESFLAADKAVRASTLEAVERRVSDAVRALRMAVLSDYYETPTVLTALGWPADPPQPAGRAVAETDEITAARLNRVARRARLWRD